jgi:hypothetical protein
MLALAIIGGGVAFGFDGKSMGIGFGCGWLIGVFQAVNGLMLKGMLN